MPGARPACLCPIVGGIAIRPRLQEGITVAGPALPGLTVVHESLRPRSAQVGSRGPLATLAFEANGRLEKDDCLPVTGDICRRGVAHAFHGPA